MTNHASKLFFGASGFGLAASFLYQVVVGDRAGSYLFLGLAVVAVIAGCAVQGAVGRDWAPRVEADSAPDRRPVDATDIGRPSPWPFLMALAAGDIAIGAAYGAGWMLAGVGVAVIPAMAWLVQTWREHPAWTARHGDRLAQRLVAPLVTPVGTLLIALFVAVNLSRTLLAVSTTASWVTALIVAVVVLAVLAFIATRPRVSQGAIAGIAALGVATAVGVGVVGAAAGEREFHSYEDLVPEATIVAANVAFDEVKLMYPAAATARLTFVNNDAGMYHNVAFYTRKDAGRPLFNGKPIPSGEIDYSFTTPKNPGSYYFVCDFHPNMEGELVVTEGEPAPEAEQGSATDEESDH